MTECKEPTGKDVKYLRIDLWSPTAYSEYLLDADGKDIIGYIDGEDTALLFPHIDNKHPMTKVTDCLVIDVKTGQIVNWKPYSEQELDDILEEFEEMRKEWWESGGDVW